MPEEKGNQINQENIMHLVIYYNSKKGTTAKYAVEMAAVLRKKNISVDVFSTEKYEESQLEKATHIMLGAWTHGLFIIMQHPDKTWVEFAQNLPSLDNKKVSLFTTYKLATGSMFRKMKKHLKGVDEDLPILKSNTGMPGETEERFFNSFLK